MLRLLAVLSGLHFAASASLRVVGTAPVVNPAFAALVKGDPSDSKVSLLLSQFTGNPLATDGLALVPDIGNDFPSSGGNFSGSVKPFELLSNITWPNTVQPADPSLVGPSGYLVSGGFLVPPKSVGAVHVVGLQIDPATGTPSVSAMAKISTDKGNALFDGWFYHKSISGESRHHRHACLCLCVCASRLAPPRTNQPRARCLWCRDFPPCLWCYCC
jgi:hypothetical protein